jgi:hypothetical protein
MQALTNLLMNVIMIMLMGTILSAGRIVTMGMIVGARMIVIVAKQPCAQKPSAAIGIA